MTTLAPCAASSRTMALPMPLLPPVTMATLPERDMFADSCRKGFWLGAYRGLSRCSGSVGRGGQYEVGDQRVPSGLVRGAQAHAGIAVEVLVERQVVLP